MGRNLVARSLDEGRAKLAKKHPQYDWSNADVDTLRNWGVNLMLDPPSSPTIPPSAPSAPSAPSKPKLDTKALPQTVDVSIAGIKVGELVMRSSTRTTKLGDEVVDWDMKNVESKIEINGFSIGIQRNKLQDLGLYYYLTRE